MSDKPVPVNQHRRLRAEEQTTLATLLRQNVPLATIADQLGVSEGSLMRACEDAKARLKSATLLAVDHWIKASSVASERGFHQPAKDLLEAVNVIEKVPTQVVNAAPKIVVQVGFNLPGIPAAPTEKAIEGAVVSRDASDPQDP